MLVIVDPSWAETNYYNGNREFLVNLESWNQTAKWCSKRACWLLFCHHQPFALGSLLMIIYFILFSKRNPNFLKKGKKKNTIFKNIFKIKVVFFKN